MRKIKIFVSARDDSSYTVKASYYFFQELKRTAEIVISNESGFAADIIERHQFNPDFVYIHDYMENGAPKVYGLKDLSVPFAVGLHDLHYLYQQRKKMLEFEKVKHIFTFCRDKFVQWYPEFAEYMIWLPHHVHTDIYKDYGLKKDIDLLMTGAAMVEFYPLRASIIERFKNRDEFVYHAHPGYRQIQQSENNVLVGTAYAQELNRAKICLTSDSVYQYPVKKYYEITACRSLLLAPSSQELTDLGFCPGVNFVSINENNFEEKAYYYLKHEQERNVIAKNGMQLTLKRHSTHTRVKEFMESVQKIIQADGKA